MNDDLDDLKAALDAATPAPDAARKAANLALARKNFETLQGSQAGARPISSRPIRGLWTGARSMLNTFTARAALTASTAIVAVGFVLLTPLGENLMPDLRSDDLAVMPAPAPTPLDAAQGAALRAVRPSATLSEAPASVQDALADEDAQSVATVAPERRLAAQEGDVSQQPMTRKMHDATVAAPQLQDSEAFANADANPVHVTARDPVSTFSIDVDTASYSVIRNSLTHGQVPPKDAVRIEEMVNYFTYAYPEPDGDAAFRPAVSVSQTPWNPDTQLVHIGLQGAMPTIAERPPLNLVFLIDTSGSMNDPDKLPLLKQSFRLILGQLRPEDSVAIVTYAGSAGLVLEPTPASERGTILLTLDSLGAGGSTAGQAGLQQAYATAHSMADQGEVTRVILATDGDFNVGLSDPQALKDYIAAKRDSGTYLSVLGFGRGNLDDATMQALAQNGNGTAAYIDTLGEAQKVLVDQLTGALFPIANDVKVQVEFNPATVAEYRLIGYETRALRREDFNNDRIDAGDIGAGHQVTALYEITPTGSPARLNDPLRYGGADAVVADSAHELGFLRLRYKAPRAAESQLIETPITADLAPQQDAGFAFAIAGFGQLLRGGEYLGDWSFADAIALATAHKGRDPFGYRAEAVQLMRLAQSLSAR